VARAEAALAAHGRRTILFVDEVHRFNKAQQDAFLPYVEKGLFTFIGATTENPSFEVNSALLSRASVYVLESLSADDLGQLLARSGLEADEGARARLVGFADGDARRLLNAVEILQNARPAGMLDAPFVESTLARNLRRFDKAGEQFYDQISALHKSVRGSDPDASLYWLVRMLDGGAEDGSGVVDAEGPVALVAAARLAEVHGAEAQPRHPKAAVPAELNAFEHVFSPASPEGRRMPQRRGFRQVFGRLPLRVRTSRPGGRQAVAG